MSTTREAKYHEQGVRDGRGLGTKAAAQARTVRRLLADGLRLPPDEAARRTLANYDDRLAALPSPERYPELRGVRDCLLAYHAGVAAGSGMPLEDVYLRANYLHMMVNSLRFAQPTASSGPGCTLVYFPDSERGPLLANNNDGLASSQDRMPAPWFFDNRAGLLFFTVSSGVYDDEVSPELFPVPAFMMTRELCGDVSEATDLLTRLNHFWGPCNLLVADAHGDAAVIEKSTCRYGLRHSTDGFAATTEMSAQTPEHRAYLWETRERSLVQNGTDRDGYEWAYWQAAERRSERLQTHIAAAAAAPTFAGIESIIYEHTGEPDQVHMDGSLCHPDQPDGEWTLRTTIWVPQERRAQSSWAEPPVSGHLTPRTWSEFDAVAPVF